MPRISQPEQLLMESLKQLENDWQVARLDWRDEARQHFEEDILEELMPAVKTAASAAAELTTLLRRVVRECR